MKNEQLLIICMTFKISSFVRKEILQNFVIYEIL